MPPLPPASQHSSAFTADQEAIATLRHELRTPLVGMMGLTEMLAESVMNEEQSALLRSLLGAYEHLASVIERALPSSAVAPTAGAGAFRFSPGELVTDVSRLFSVEATSKGLTLDIDIAPESFTHVVGDATAVRQVLVNLVSNAVKFTVRGGVRASVARDGDRVRFEVADSGPGFSDAVAASHTISRPLRPRSDGSGVGLEISRRLISGLGGRLVVQSSSENGSLCHFALHLPLSTPQPATAHAAAPEAVGVRDSTARVLVVDDDPLSCQVIVHLVGRLGCAVTSANSGREALRRHATETYDVIVLDRRLGDLDAVDVAAVIRDRDAVAGRHTYLIAATATATANDRAQCLAAGMDDYLGKPVRPADIERAFAPLCKPAEGLLPQ